MKHQLVNNYER